MPMLILNLFYVNVNSEHILDFSHVIEDSKITLLLSLAVL